MQWSAPVASAPFDLGPVTGRVDRDGRLTAADPALLRLQEEAGSKLGAPLAAVLATHTLAAFGVLWDESTIGILSVLVFGAGTDYALLLISRYRDQLRVTADRREAMALALTRERRSAAATQRRSRRSRASTRMRTRPISSMPPPRPSAKVRSSTREAVEAASSAPGRSAR